ncbi:MAG TPA: UDP-N-acetylmuramoyl-L-alanine--D-glutamate ligase, partial [Pirellulales bacterium]|nr:UDP-N-acetylmuramoyl-L-alanine--D-glutamate ligase [Pirellulales bacterium]
MEVAGKRLTVMGLGRHGGGVGAARWLAEHGARVTITDRLPAEALGNSIVELAGVPIERWRLGEHDERDFRACDALVVNPAVRPDERWVQLAAASGATLTSEIELLLSVCPALVVGVTGSVGKSSTASMLDQILQAAGRRSWLGGNIGGSLLGDAAQMCRDDVVVLELSSFQLYWLSAAARMPQLALVTNCEPNHLDWHPTFDHYRQSKQRLLCGQQPGDRYILSAALADDPAWQRPWPGERLAAGRLAASESLSADGSHQRDNANLAAAAAIALGCERPAISAGLAAFRGLPHRLQRIDLGGQRHVIDDSKATTPTATLAAIEAVAAKAWWLIGGANKGADFAPLIERLAD